MKSQRRKIKFKAIGYGIVRTNDKDEIIDIDDIEVEEYENVEIIY